MALKGCKRQAYLLQQGVVEGEGNSRHSLLLAIYVQLVRIRAALRAETH